MDTSRTGQLSEASHVEAVQRWRLHHAVWGDGFDLDLYLRREEALKEADFCRSGHRLWLLRDGDGSVLASCETYAAPLLATTANGGVTQVRMETVASVLVEPRLRLQGYARGLMAALGERLRFDGVAAATLYSDVGAQLYRRAGYFLHPAREGIREVAAEAWPAQVEAVGLGDVADLLAGERERLEAELAHADAPAVAEVPLPERIAWFALRAHYRAWARGQQASEIVGARGPDGGFALWAATAAHPTVHVLVWRPASESDARLLAQAACAEAAEARLRHVVWWDVDRDTGLDPYRTPLRRPPGVVVSDRTTALPMLAWWGQPPMPLVWAGIEHFGWA
jgi:hypothetical protein